MALTELKRRFDGTYWVLAGPEVRDHPLVARRKDGSSLGWVHEHKYMLYEKIGPGPHACYLCGKTIEWSNRGRGIQADHLDDDHDNNDPANLEPACVVCNTDRGRTETRTELGKRVNATPHACPICGEMKKSKAAMRGHAAWCGEERRAKMLDRFGKRATSNR